MFCIVFLTIDIKTGDAEMPRAGASLAQPPPIRWDAISGGMEHQLAGRRSGLAGPVSLGDINYCLYAAISEILDSILPDYEKIDQ